MLHYRAHFDELAQKRDLEEAPEELKARRLAREKAGALAKRKRDLEVEKQVTLPPIAPHLLVLPPRSHPPETTRHSLALERGSLLCCWRTW